MAIKKAYGWSDIDVVLFGDISVHITNITYEVTREKTNGYGKGASPVRRGRGKKNYESISMTIAMPEVVQIKEALRAKYGIGFDLTDIIPFDIPIIYDNGEKVVKDVIRDFEWTRDGGGGGEDDQDIVIELPGICSNILFNLPV
ncbi:MAG: hypothetical protein NW226_17515 [Microscillaceae bacterium]|nr:hypothetical protein [Microscillaceae bacterium]